MVIFWPTEMQCCPWPSQTLVAARANTAVKERQILIDLAEDHPIKRQFNTHNEMLTLFQTVLDTIKEQDSPDLKLKSLIILKNRGILLELTNKEAVVWTKNNGHWRKLAEATGGNLTIKDRFFNVVVPFVPIWTQLESKDTLRNIEEDNKILQNAIASARWIKCHDRDRTHPYTPYPDLSTPIPSHLNQSRAPNTKPEPSDPLASQQRTPEHSNSLASSQRIPDPTHPQPLLFLASSRFPTRRLSTFTPLCQIYSRRFIGLATVVGRSPIAYLPRSMRHSLSFLALYISVHSSMSHHSLPFVCFLCLILSSPSPFTLVFHLSLFLPPSTLL